MLTDRNRKGFPIRRSRKALAVFSVVAVVVSGGHPAIAAQVTSITYDVTGGTFDGPVDTGPITGGSVTYTALPGAPFLSTPALGAPTGRIVVTLTGPSGFHADSFSNMSAMLPYISFINVSVDPTARRFLGVRTNLDGTGGIVGINRTAGTYIVGFSMTRGDYVNHEFVVGNEVVAVFEAPVPALGPRALLAMCALFALVAVAMIRGRSA